MQIETFMPGHWPDSDDILQQDQQLLASSSSASPTSTNGKLNRTTSVTMDEDKSQPPTPDGTGLPTNFHPIGPGIYRSSYPQTAHFEKLQTFAFKTIITLVPEPIQEPNLTFMRAHGITYHHIHVLANKDPKSYTSAATVAQILRLVMDKRNHPVLIHCNKGKHRTGCITACFRKVTGWTTDACIDEYERYSTPKDRDLDKAFIRRFEATAELKAFALENGLVGGAFKQPYEGESGESEYTAGTVRSDQSYLVGAAVN